MRTGGADGGSAPVRKASTRGPRAGRRVHPLYAPDARKSGPKPQRRCGAYRPKGKRKRQTHRTHANPQVHVPAASAASKSTKRERPEATHGTEAKILPPDEWKKLLDRLDELIEEEEKSQRRFFPSKTASPSSRRRAITKPQGKVRIKLCPTCQDSAYPYFRSLIRDNGDEVAKEKESIR